MIKFVGRHIQHEVFQSEIISIYKRKVMDDTVMEGRVIKLFTVGYYFVNSTIK